MQQNGQLTVATLLRGPDEWNARRRAAGDHAVLPDLSGTTLARANLRGAQLQKLLLRRADLSCACLAGADLWQTDAESADLHESDLSGANLCRARLTGADLTGASLTEVGGLGACFVGANLCGANAADSNLKEADFHGANLTGTDLRRANLYEADLTGADLTNADLTGANLNGAVLEGARLDGAVLRNANLRMSATPTGFPSYGSRPTWSSNGSRLSQVLQTAASVEGTDFDEEFTRRHLPSLKRKIADVDANSRAVVGAHQGSRWAAYRLLAKPCVRTEESLRFQDVVWLGVSENGEPCSLGLVKGPRPASDLGREAVDHPARSYRMTLPAAELPVNVREAMTELISCYGPRRGVPTPHLTFSDSITGSEPTVTVTVDAASLDYFRARLGPIRRTLLLPETCSKTGVATR